MADNPYASSPLRIGVVSPSAGVRGKRGAPTVRTVVLAGDVPPAVRRAALRQEPSVLSRHYGRGWRTKLAPLTFEEFERGGPEPAAVEMVGGEDGVVLGGEDSGELGVVDGVANDGASGGDALAFTADDLRVTEKKASAVRPYDFSPWILYPDDTLDDLRRKVCAAAGVPPFRQCVVWWTGSSYAAPYRVSCDGESIDVDPRAFASAYRQLRTHAAANAQEGDAMVAENVEVLGFPLDGKMLRGARAVEPLDLSLRVEVIPFTRAGGPVVWVFDAEEWVGPRRTQLAASGVESPMVRGAFIEKFWPLLALVWTEFLRDPAGIAQTYPPLDPGRDALEASLREEAKALDSESREIESSLAKEARSRKLATSIRTALFRADTGARACDVRALFDTVRLSPRVVAARVEFTQYGAKVAAEKVYGVPDLRVQWPAALTAQMRGAAVVIAVLVSATDAAARTTLEQEQSRYLFVRVDAEGGMLVRATFAEDTERSINTLDQFVNEHLTPGLAALHEARAALTPAAPLLARAFAAKKGPYEDLLRLELLTLSARLRWIAPTTDRAFAEFRRQIERLQMAGIMAPPRNVAAKIRGDFAFVYLKGTLAPPPEDEREGDPNGYVYLTSAEPPPQRDVVNVEAANRLSDIALTVGEADQVLFFSAYSTLLTLFYQMQKEHWFDALPSREAGRHRLRRLQAVDPDLFNLKRHGAATVFSRICQIQYQPLAFSPEEAKLLSAKERQNLTKLHNFTTGQHSYYSCPSRTAPNLNFITGKHPQGYCLPCCAKSRPHPDSARGQTAVRCRDAGRADAAAVTRRRVMTFGRELEMGRLAVPPPDVAAVLFDTHDALEADPVEIDAEGAAEDDAESDAMPDAESDAMPDAEDNAEDAAESDAMPDAEDNAEDAAMPDAEGAAEGAAEDDAEPDVEPDHCITMQCEDSGIDGGENDSCSGGITDAVDALHAMQWDGGSVEPADDFSGITDAADGVAFGGEDALHDHFSGITDAVDGVAFGGEDALHDHAVGAFGGRTGNVLRNARGAAYYVTGVPQNPFGSGRGGAWSSVALLLGIPPAALSARIAKHLRAHPSAAEEVLEGEFASIYAPALRAEGTAAGMTAALAAALAAAVTHALTGEGKPPHPLAAAEFAASRKGLAWDAVLLDLALPALGVHLLMFHGTPSGRSLEFAALASAVTRATLESPAPLRHPVACLVSQALEHGAAVFPLMLVDAAEFLRRYSALETQSALDTDAAQMRAVEAALSSSVRARVFPPDGNIAALLRGVFSAQRMLQAVSAPRPPDAQSLAAFLASGPGRPWRAHAWYQTRRGAEVYGAVLRRGPRASAYLSLRGALPAGAAQPRQAPFMRREWSLPLTELAALVRDYNRFASSVREQAVPGMARPARGSPYALIEIDGGLRGPSGKVCASVCRSLGVVCWHDDASETACRALSRGSWAVRDLGIDPDAYAKLPQPGAPLQGGNIALRSDAAEERYRSRLFERAVVAIAAAAAQARDQALRARLASRIKAATSPSAAMTAVAAVLGSDHDALRFQIMFRTNSHAIRWRQAAMKFLQQSQFDFDRAVLLRQKGRLLSLVAVADARALEKARAAGDGFGQAGEKIRVPPADFASLADLVEQTFAGPRSRDLLDSGLAAPPFAAPAALTATPLVELDFEQRPGEFIRLAGSDAI